MRIGELSRELETAQPTHSGVQLPSSGKLKSEARAGVATSPMPRSGSAPSIATASRSRGGPQANRSRETSNSMTTVARSADEALILLDTWGVPRARRVRIAA